MSGTMNINGWLAWLLTDLDCSLFADVMLSRATCSLARSLVFFKMIDGYSTLAHFLHDVGLWMDSYCM
jgi:hypothetical protein